MKYVQFTKRTDEPKLSHLEKLLTIHGISSRREGRSFHAPILMVPDSELENAHALLESDVFFDGRSYDDIPDDDAVFCDIETEDSDEFDDDTPRGMGWVGCDGLP